MTQFGLLGPLEVVDDDGPVPVSGGRRRALLARLLLSANRAVSAERLAEDAWEGAPSPATKSTLSSNVYLLRRLLGPDRIESRGGCYSLRVGADELDMTCFETDLAAARRSTRLGEAAAAVEHYERALDRWRGPALADAAGASWAVGVATRLDELRLGATDDLLDARLLLGEHDAVVAAAEAAVDEQPLRERRWMSLMLALSRSGRQADSLRAFQRYRRHLVDELGIEPSEQIAALERAIVLGTPDAGTGVAPVTAIGRHRIAQRSIGPAPEDGGMSPQPLHVVTGGGPSTERRHRARTLPHPISSFIGRRDELGQLHALLADHRLVTITGAGGAGKTRLAVEVARGHVEEFADGVVLIDFSTIDEPDLVAVTVAEALGVKPSADEGHADLLADVLSDQHALLLFDNCEHLVDACAVLAARLLEASATLSVLATSREALRVSGERVWPIPPLATPGMDELGRFDAGRFDAVELFVDRAISTGAVFVADPRTIARIVVQLDGLPLAIELAAAQVRSLGLDGLADGLHDQFGLLTTGSRTAPRRQQTLLDTVAWSWRLLSGPERHLLCRLSVFAGSFTADAARALVETSTSRDPGVEALLAQLVAKSMLALDDPPTVVHRVPLAARFRLLESIRQFAGERLDAADGGLAVSRARAAHAAFYCDLAAQAGAKLTGPEQVRWLEMLELDIANLRLAMQHLAAAPGRRRAYLGLLVDLRRFWHCRGHTQECEDRLLPLVETPAPDDPPTLAVRGLILASEIVRYHDLDTAERYGRRALAMARHLADDSAATWAMTCVSAFLGHLDKREEGKALAAEAVRLARRLGDPVLLAEAQNSQGMASLDTPVDALRCWQKSLATAEQAGDTLYEAWAHNNIGNAMLATADLDGALRHFETAVALFEDLGSADPVIELNLGWAALQQGQLRRASDCFTSTLLMARRRGVPYVQSWAVLGLACCATRFGQPELAATLHGFADAEAVYPWEVPESSYRADDLAELRGLLSARFEPAYRAGLDARHDRGVELALQVATVADPVDARGTVGVIAVTGTGDVVVPLGHAR